MPAAELDQLTAFGAELLAACREQLANLKVTRFGPVNASKRTSDAMHCEVSATAAGYRLQLFMPESGLTLIFGRKPGKFPPLIDIQQWIVDKGIVPTPDENGKATSITANAKGYSPLAFLFARAIKEKGNTVYQNGPPSSLFAKLLDKDSVMAAVKARIFPLLVQDVQTQIHAALTA